MCDGPVFCQLLDTGRGFFFLNQIRQQNRGLIAALIHYYLNCIYFLYFSVHILTDLCKFQAQFCKNQKVFTVANACLPHLHVNAKKYDGFTVSVSVLRSA